MFAILASQEAYDSENETVFTGFVVDADAQAATDFANQLFSRYQAVRPIWTRIMGNMHTLAHEIFSKAVDAEGLLLEDVPRGPAQIKTDEDRKLLSEIQAVNARNQVKVRRHSVLSASAKVSANDILWKQFKEEIDALNLAFEDITLEQEFWPYEVSSFYIQAASIRKPK